MTLNWMIPGKADFNDIYDADDPHPYYTTMQTLDYQLKGADLFKKLQK